MTKTAEGLSNEDFFCGYLPEYLDGDLPGPLAMRFEEMLKAPGHALVPQQFQAQRGRLQLNMQSFYLKETETQVLRAMVQDPSVTVTKENMRIEQLGRGELINTWLRRISLAAVVLGIVGGLTWKFMPRSGPAFKPLEYLGYEALAMEEDTQSRMDLPTNDIKEIRQYLASYPGLDFKPRSLKAVAERWKPIGVSMIDYEIAKVSAVQYLNIENKERLFHFSFAGKLSDLPKADSSTMDGIKFQTYGSEQLNLVAWQHDSGVVSLLVGRRSTAELFEIAARGTKD